MGPPPIVGLLLKLPMGPVILWDPIFDNHEMIIKVGPRFDDKMPFYIEISDLEYLISFYNS